MNVIGIDTTNGNCTIVITKEERNFFYNNINEPNPSEKLFTIIESLLFESQIKYSDIDIISVTKGPGGFTGTKLGMSAAIGINKIINKTIVSISTLELFAYSAISQQNTEDIIALIDAKKEYAYFQKFNNTLLPLCKPILLKKEEVITHIKQNNKIVSNYEINSFAKITPDLTKINEIGIKKYKDNNFGDNNLLYVRSLNLKI